MSIRRNVRIICSTLFATAVCQAGYLVLLLACGDITPERIPTLENQTTFGIVSMTLINLIVAGFRRINSERHKVHILLMTGLGCAGFITSTVFAEWIKERPIAPAMSDMGQYGYIGVTITLFSLVVIHDIYQGVSSYRPL